MSSDRPHEPVKILFKNWEHRYGLTAAALHRLMRFYQFCGKLREPDQQLNGITSLTNRTLFNRMAQDNSRYGRFLTQNNPGYRRVFSSRNHQTQDRELVRAAAPFARQSNPLSKRVLRRAA
jgi:hypothetical protein